MSRTPIRLLVLSLASALAAVVLPATAQAAPYCGIAWGSLPKVQTTLSDREMVNGVRAGQHACFDRLVIDIGGQDTTFGSYDVRYVPLVHTDGKGDPVPVRGAADLQIVLTAPSYDQYGNTTFNANRREIANVSGYRTFRQVAGAGSYEGYTTLALGVRARLPFRVFTLAGTPASDDTPRLVIDVAHSW